MLDKEEKPQLNMYSGLINFSSQVHLYGTIQQRGSLHDSYLLNIDTSCLTETAKLIVLNWDCMC